MFRLNVEKPKSCVYKSTKVDKTSEKIIEQNKYHKMYAFISGMYLNKEIPRGNYGDTFKLTRCILFLGSKYHMEQDIQDFVPGSLAQMEKNH